MRYLRVEWKHEFSCEPVLLYSELNDGRREVRKVEVFPDGSYGYASEGSAKGTTRLSEGIIPAEEEIAEDVQFVPEVITREEFEAVWGRAVALSFG